MKRYSHEELVKTLLRAFEKKGPKREGTILNITSGNFPVYTALHREDPVLEEYNSIFREFEAGGSMTLEWDKAREKVRALRLRDSGAAYALVGWRCMEEIGSLLERALSQIPQNTTWGQQLTGEIRKSFKLRQRFVGPIDIYSPSIEKFCRILGAMERTRTMKEIISSRVLARSCTGDPGALDEFSEELEYVFLKYISANSSMGEMVYAYFRIIRRPLQTMHVYIPRTNSLIPLDMESPDLVPRLSEMISEQRARSLLVVAGEKAFHDMVVLRKAPAGLILGISEFVPLHIADLIKASDSDVLFLADMDPRGIEMARWLEEAVWPRKLINYRRGMERADLELAEKLGLSKLLALPEMTYLAEIRKRNILDDFQPMISLMLSRNLQAETVCFMQKTPLPQNPAPLQTENIF